MPMTTYTGETEIITNLGTTPAERGLETDEFKAKFDEGLKAFVTWFNDTHKTEFDAHLAKKASEEELGHVIVDGETIEADENGVISTVEKVLKNPLTYYVNIARPDNNGDGLTPATAFKNLQYAINKIPKYLKADVKIRVIAGDYSTEGQIIVQGFYGHGVITIIAYDGTNDVADNTLAANYKIDSIMCRYCYNPTVTIRSLQSTYNSNARKGFYATQSRIVNFFYCNDTVNATSKIAFAFDHSTDGQVAHSIVSNKLIALVAGYASQVVSYNWTAGSGNGTGLRVDAGTIMKWDANRPQGTTAQDVRSGGEIR